MKMVERLVGFGANLNKTTDDGNTALHITLGRNNMAPPTDETPKIKAVRVFDWFAVIDNTIPFLSL